MTAEIRAAYDEFLKRLDAGQVAAQACKAGDRMPGFLLPNAEGRLVESTDLLQDGGASNGGAVKSRRSLH